MNNESILKKCFTKDPSIVSRKIVGEFMLVPIRSKTAEIDSIYTLNEVAARIWELVDGTITAERIRDIILQEYEVSSAEAEADLVELLVQLESIGAVKEA